ncbi:MAG: hypothetical protein IAB75_08825 [Bacteroidetes bacterium]|uniref:Transposase IS200-like domain-containing protein n=1 Tax=Candidatus Cryptobacteroides avicola TaxID=2840757 RepID=A0A940DSP8_9BACT|nr:hypothetical protein [Candidatus Cryptobacteroides avicola]
MRGQDDFYHICTNGMNRKLMFRCEEDFISGMNSIPVCSASAGIRIYAFCLMDNHVHFIAKGPEQACISFIRLYKRLRSSWAGSRYGEKTPFGDADISISCIDTAEYLLTAIAYVLRNPVAAGLPVMPWAYRWSSASLYFRGGQLSLPGSRRISEMSISEQRSVLKSRAGFPDTYIIEADGVIFPGCYTEYEAVEKMFASPKRMLYYLSKNDDISVALESGIVAKARYRDSEIANSLDWLCMEKFHCRKFSALPIERQYLMAKELRRRYGCPTSQISRVTGLDPDLLREMLG